MDPLFQFHSFLFILRGFFFSWMPDAIKSTLRFALEISIFSGVLLAFLTAI
jgi:hypothetical protein